MDRVVRRLRNRRLDMSGSSIPSDSTVIAAVDDAPYALSLEEVVMRVGGDPEEVRATLERLVMEGHLKMTADRASRAYYALGIQLK